VSIDPAIALAITPARSGVQPGESFGDHALLLLLAMPDWYPRMDHHLVGTDHLIARTFVEKLDECIRHRFQVGSGFFVIAPATDSPRSEARSAPPPQLVPVARVEAMNPQLRFLLACDR